MENSNNTLFYKVDDMECFKYLDLFNRLTKKDQTKVLDMAERGSHYRDIQMFILFKIELGK